MVYACFNLVAGILFLGLDGLNWWDGCGKGKKAIEMFGG